MRPLAGAATDAVPAGTRLPSLTGLRWLGAFGTFVAHTNVMLPIPYTQGLFGLGSAGVTFFFVLSGFVLLWTYTAQDRPRWFYGRRFARIWPLLFLAVALPIFFALAFPDPDLPVDSGHLLFLGLLSILLLLAWSPAQLESSNPVVWSTSALAFFYLLFPFLARPTLRQSLRRLAWLAAGLVVFAWVIRIVLWIAYPPPAELDIEQMGTSTLLILGYYAPVARVHEFLLGMVTAAAVRKGWRGISVRSSVVLLTVAFFVLWLFRDASWRIALPYDAQTQVTLPLFALLIAAYAVRDIDGGRSWLRSRVMLRLGEWSFAFYLFHFLVLIPVAAALYPSMTIVDFFFEPVAPAYSHLTWVLVVLAGSLAMAAFLYRFYESPLERRLRRALSPRMPRAGTPPPPASPGGTASASSLSVNGGSTRPTRIPSR
jgi:peptidoglycan/LPS O-acetylase OafA/YrhL